MIGFFIILFYVVSKSTSTKLHPRCFISFFILQVILDFYYCILQAIIKVVLTMHKIENIFLKS